jgi:hypothetical protein
MPTDLFDMEFDEISFVKSGANQKADVVLWKSDREESTVDAAAKLLMDSEPYLTHAEAVSKIYQARPDLYEAELEARARHHSDKEQERVNKVLQRLGGGAVSKADQFESERRDMFVDVERLADQLQLSNRLTRAQAVAKALSMRQDIYDRSVLMASDNVPVQEESAR